MMKRLSAVAVAVSLLFVAVPSTHAYWDYFSVIDAGSVEANYHSGGRLKIRYGLTDNIEYFASNDAGGVGLHANYMVGGRYQVMPEMLALSLDVAIPTANNGGHDIGAAPGVQFHMGINDMISLGLGAHLGMNFNHQIAPAVKHDSTEMLMNLGFGLEVDFSLSDNVLFYVGCDFGIDDLTGDGNNEFDIGPGFGLVFSVDNLSVGTGIGIDLDRTNREGKESIGLTAGIDFGIKF